MSPLPSHPLAAFDRTHAAWSTLLASHVRWNAPRVASGVDYVGLARDRSALGAYRQALANVSETRFSEWPVEERLAFLINAYNANTVELVLTSYPGLTSVKDLGGLFSSPWKQRFIELLGATRSLDEIEHKMIRSGLGRTEARVHFALSCASVGCPALRHEAYRGETLGEQLDDQTRRFLAGEPSARQSRARARNRSSALESGLA